MIPCVIEGNFFVKKLLGDRPVLIKALQPRYHTSTVSNPEWVQVLRWCGRRGREARGRCGEERRGGGEGKRDGKGEGREGGWQEVSAVVTVSTPGVGGQEVRRLGRRWGGREARGRLVREGKQRGLRSLAQQGHADAGNGEGKERA